MGDGIESRSGLRPGAHRERRQWTPSSVLRRARQVLREEGVAALWFKVLGEIVYRRMLLLERRLDEPIDTVAVGGDLAFGVLRPDEIQRCLELRPDRSLDELRGRLAQREVCYVARKSGLVIAQAWVTRRTAWVAYLERGFEFGPDDHYLYEIVVSPELRGQRIAGALLAHAYRELAARGGSRAILFVTFENGPGLRAVTRNRERPFAVQAYLGRGRLRCDFRRPWTARDPS